MAEILRSKKLLSTDSTIFTDSTASESSVELIALSGISGRPDVAAYESQGVTGILVGETLMRSKDPAGAIQELVGRKQEQYTHVKVCGITDPGDATVACKAGCEMGLSQVFS